MIFTPQKWDYKNYDRTKHTKVRKGYLGHVTRIACLMQKLTEKEEMIKTALESKLQ